MAATTRPVSDVFRPALITISVFICIISGCARNENRGDTYQQIDNQIEAGDYQKARENAKRHWKESPSSEWGWKFKAQYILMSIFLNDKGTAANLLRDEVPLEFHALSPRYQYLRAYLSLRQNDPSASRQLASVVELSKQVNDPVTECEALNLLARLNPKDAVTLLTRALTIIRKSHLEFLECSTLNELGESMKDRQQYSDAVSYFQQAAPLAHKHHARFLEALIRAQPWEVLPEHR